MVIKPIIASRRLGRAHAAVIAAVMIAVAGVATLSTAARAAPAATTFADCADCPVMVRIPQGQFTMGSPANEPYRGAEKQHRVTIASPFALSKYEITFAQWDACVAHGGCGGYRPDDQGWGRGNHPVIGISWNDAKAYVAWLSKTTGKRYRLASESEWEYAARARTTTAFSFGTTINTTEANYDGSTAYGTGPKGVNREKTLPVGSFAPNAFGLYDMHGNVWEWTEDCWSDEYTAATPANGAPYVQPKCAGHVLRGGSWEDHPADVRSAARVGGGSDDQSWSDGFRVALSLQ